MREFDHEGIMLATFQAKLFEASLTLCEESSPIFMRRFFNSELAEKLDTKSPHTLLLDEEDAVRQLNEEFGKSTYGKTKYGAEAMYYVGWFYRYIAYTRMIPSHIVYKLIKPKIIIDNYYVYHTQDEEWVFERVISNLGLSEVDFNLNERFKRAYRRYLSESKEKLG